MNFPQRFVRPKTAFSLSSGRKRPRQEKKDHLKFIRGLPCCICGTHKHVEAAHIRMGSQLFGKRETGMGEKPDDCWTIPLCAPHHRIQHDVGEESFWLTPNFGPIILALALWRASGDEEAGELIIAGLKDGRK